VTQLKVIISKELKKFMRYAKQITEIEGKETGFYLHYFNLPGQNNVDPYDIFHSELVIGDNRGIYLHSKYRRLTKDLEGKIVICGSFHIHPFKKYLNDYTNSETVDKNRLAYVEECCRNCLSFDDIETLLVGTMKRDSTVMITCLLSDTENNVSYYIPRKHVSIDELTGAYKKFKKDQQPLACTETIYTKEGPVTFPTPKYRRAYKYIFDLFDKNRFDLNSEDEIIDI
jgi:hypothetical protein